MKKIRGKSFLSIIFSFSNKFNLLIEICTKMAAPKFNKIEFNSN